MKVRNYSRKREAILAKIREAKSHFTAEWVYQELKEEYPDLSLATVYRNITLFKEEGSIVSVGTVDGKELFDSILTPHGHFICLDCNAVADVSPQAGQPKITGYLENVQKCKVCRVDVIAYGSCEKCSTYEQQQN